MKGCGSNSPIPELHGRKDTGPIHVDQRRGVIGVEDTSPPLDLHIGAAGVAEDRPADGGEIIE